MVEYESESKWPFGAAHTSIAIEIGEPMAAGDFDNFLTARYRLYTLAGGRLAFAQIEHAPWPLQEGRVLRLEQDLIEQVGSARAARGTDGAFFNGPGCDGLDSCGLA